MKGFVDLQVNGYLGVDFSAPGLDVGQLRQVVTELRQRGTIAFCPTMITCAMEVYEQNLPVLAKAIQENDLAPHLLGIHLEGPFISSQPGAVGAHPARHTTRPDVERYERLCELAGNHIRLVTVAPELPGAADLIAAIVDKGATASLGHHLADGESIRHACDRGARAATHLGNGIPNRLPRHPNPIWDQLAEKRLRVMLITDGHHVPESFIRTTVRSCTSDRLIVVSDSAPVAGLPPGTYQTLGQEAVLEESGRLWSPQGDHLMGSSSCMLECMNYLAGLGELSEEELWQAGHRNPLQLIGRELDSRARAHCPEVTLQNGQFLV